MRDEVAHETAEVSAEDAYEAAVDRAARTQHALILAEAQILTWKRRYAEAVQRAEEVAAEAEKLRTEVERADAVTAQWKGHLERRTGTLKRRAEAAEERLREVEHGEEESAGGGAAVRGEADSQGPVPF